MAASFSVTPTTKLSGLNLGCVSFGDLILSIILVKKLSLTAGLTAGVVIASACIANNKKIALARSVGFEGDRWW